MQLSKIDLSHLVAIAHKDDQLGLVIDRGDSLDIVEIPAPLAAYEGLCLLNAIVTGTAAIVDADLNHLPGVAPSPPMLPVQSTMARAIGYDPHQAVLQVQFKNGSVYQYDDVDADTWHEFQVTDSPGQFFNREIKGNYRSRRIG